MSLAILPLILSGITAGASIFPGLLGAGQAQDQGQGFPEPPVAENTTFDDEILSQTEKNRETRRIANRRSRALTNLQDDPIQSDSLLQILAEGQ